MSECSVKHLKWGATWPSREQFHELADAGYRVIPIVRRLLADSLTPVGFYERLAGGRSGTFILESAEYGGTWSRYSFIGVNSMAQRAPTTVRPTGWARSRSACPSPVT